MSLPYLGSTSTSTPADAGLSLLLTSPLRLRGFKTSFGTKKENIFCSKSGKQTLVFVVSNKPSELLCIGRILLSLHCRLRPPRPASGRLKDLLSSMRTKHTHTHTEKKRVAASVCRSYASLKIPRPQPDLDPD